MSRMATKDAFLNTRSKRPCKYHFVGQFEIALHVLRESKTLVNACRLPCIPASTQGFLVPGLLMPTSIFGMNQQNARRLAVKGENCLFWPLS